MVGKRTVRLVGGLAYCEAQLRGSVRGPEFNAIGRVIEHPGLQFEMSGSSTGWWPSRHFSCGMLIFHRQVFEAMRIALEVTSQFVEAHCQGGTCFDLRVVRAWRALSASTAAGDP
ncbi:hypothetical protein GCM10009107_31780 [Ideonella azotifigens]|uniref:Uncharacterized protein n=2 Tax=Ideonella azotifigens TaxID=513160 RepID=A0ABP3VC36_9BURK